MRNTLNSENRAGRDFKALTLFTLLIILFSYCLSFTAFPNQVQAKTSNSSTTFQDYQAGQLLVKFQPWALVFHLVQPQDYLNAPTFKQLHLISVEPVPDTVAVFRYQLPANTDLKKAATLFGSQPDVQYAEPNRIYHLSAVSPNDPIYKNGSEYYLNKTQITAAWNITTGSPITVAVVDSGVKANHPDLTGRVLPGYNALNNNNDTTDQYGHGTFVAGIIAANTNNNAGIAGINWSAKILPVKVADTQGNVDDATSATGIRYAVDNGAKIINLSYGGEDDPALQEDNSPLQKEAVKYALSKGAIVVAAAGNTADGLPEYPAAVPGVIAVGASDGDDQVANFSSYGSFVSVVAPGIQIWSTNINKADSDFGPGDYTVSQGTSFSTPIVSGIVSLMVALKPDLTPTQALDIIEGTADKIDPGVIGRDDYSGYGRVNALKALQTIQAGDFAPQRHGLVQGKVSGVDSSSVVVTLDSVGNVTPNPDGSYQFSDLMEGVYNLRVVAPNKNVILGPVQLTVHGNNGDNQIVNFDFSNNSITVNGKLANTTPQTPQSSNAQYFAAIPPVASTPNLDYFTQTSHTLSGVFKKYWDSHGGLAIFGYPISEQFSEVSATDGKTYVVQYFERNRFEYHPEFANTPNEVELGLLGRELTAGRNFPPAVPVANTPSLTFFPQTQHTLSGTFLKYWDSHGGLAIFGYPISEPMTENGLTVQYFERNRFEYHPENAGTQYDVLLGLLGIDLARLKGYIQVNSSAKG